MSKVCTNLSSNHLFFFGGIVIGAIGVALVAIRQNSFSTYIGVGCTTVGSGMALFSAYKLFKRPSVPQKRAPREPLSRVPSAPSPSTPPIKPVSQPQQKIVKPLQEEWISEPKGRSQFSFKGPKNKPIITSACTPLALIFAAKQSIQLNGDTISEILESFVNNIERIGYINGDNYFLENSVALVELFLNSKIKVSDVWSLNGNNAGVRSEIGGIPDVEGERKTLRQIISDLKSDQAAVITFGNYSIACRRLSGGFAFFDVHNGQDYQDIEEFRSFNIPLGAYIKVCVTINSALSFLQHIIQHGSAAARDGGAASDAIEIAIIQH